MPQDPKGFVEEGFLAHPLPADGQEVVIRALLSVAEPGDYELTVSSACRSRLWVDGEQCDVIGDGYHRTANVRLSERVVVLELFLSNPAIVASESAPASDMSLSLALSRPGQRVPPPEFMTAGAGGVERGSATFRRRFRLEQGATVAKVVTGAPCALTVLLDGVVVARQEKVEYYESGLGENPMYFTHELDSLDAGEHLLEVVTDAVRDDTPFFVDLMTSSADGMLAVPSGDGWTVGPHDNPVVLAPARTGGTTHARAVRRPHPLPAAEWLTGPPEVGASAVPFELSTTAVARAQIHEVVLPAGTVAVELSGDPDDVQIEGHSVERVGRTLTLSAPIVTPTVLRMTMPATAFSAFGAAWTGPLVVTTEPSPAIFADWMEQGLGSWSGGLRYFATIEVRAGETFELDLGRVRGAVTVDVDGVRADSAFCAPFRFTLAGLSPGQHRIDVTVLGTLAPRYAAATQSKFIVPSQLRTGVTTPIRVWRTGGIGDAT